MNKLINILLSICLLFSFCTKKSPGNQNTINIKSPVIEISQIIGGCTVDNNSNYAKNIELIVADSIFTIFKPSNQMQYLPIELLFSAQVQEGEIQSAKWKVGSDPDELTSTNFKLSFDTPIDISISAEIIWTPKATASLRKDTIYKTLKIISQKNLLGSYRGINVNNPSDTFTIQISEFESNIAGTQQTFFGIDNLLKNFPVKLPVYIYSAGFGICQAPFPYEERYNVNGKFLSQPFGLAYLNSSKDSINIKYSYVEFQDALTFNNMKTTQATFIGRKL